MALAPQQKSLSNNKGQNKSLISDFWQLTFLMTIQEAQQRVDQWIKTYGVRYFNELTNMAILSEEVGEVARIIARHYGEQSSKPSDEGKDLGDELADVLWVVMCLANQTGVDLDAALERNFAKKTARDANRHKQNNKLKNLELKTKN